MQSAIIVFPGSNRERDAALALERATGKKPHMVWHSDTELPKVDLVVLPGGFSYGDYLRTGAMAAHSPIMREVATRAGKGVRVFGICNGFQILCEAQLLPGILLRNVHLKFNCRRVTLKVENTDSDFTRLCKKGQELRVIVAHGDGNYFVDDKTLAKMEGDGQIAFRYAPCSSRVGAPCPELPIGSDLTQNSASTLELQELYSYNPNGSIRDIAGVFNEKRNVLGMMPHPENAVEALHGSTDGTVLFDSITQSLAA